MIRKLKSGKYRLYSRKVDEKTGKRKNLGTFDSRTAAEKHEPQSSSSNAEDDLFPAGGGYGISRICSFPTHIGGWTID